MKYLITESPSDAFYIGTLFKNEIAKVGDVEITPAGGGRSEALSLARSLAIRHEDIVIILVINLGEDGVMASIQKHRVNSRFRNYQNIKIVHAIPNIEGEIIKIIKPTEMISLLKLSTLLAHKNKIVLKMFKQFIENENNSPFETSYYKRLKQLINSES